MNPDCQGSDAVATGQEALAVVQASVCSCLGCRV